MNLSNFTQQKTRVESVTPASLKSKSKIMKDTELILNLTKELLYNSMAQAIIKLFQTPHVVLKLLLMVFVLTAGSMSAYLVVHSILTYLSFDVSTTTRTVYEMPTYFPTITVCNYNMFTTESAYEFLRKINADINPSVDIFNRTQMSTLDYNTQSYLNQLVLFSATAAILKSNYTDEDRKKLGHSWDDILIDCTYNELWCVSDFTWTFDKMHGNCYQFNTGFNASGHRVALKQSLLGGPTLGLQLKLYSNFYKNLSMFNSFNGGHGLVLRIENASYLMNQISDEILISNGKVTSVSVQRTFKTNLPKPYSNCDLDNNAPSTISSELYKLIYHSPYEYNQELCVVQCFQQRLYQNCNCTYSWYVSIGNSDYCTTLEELKCINAFLKYFYENDLIEACRPLCPLECNRTVYGYSMSSIDLIGDSYLDYINTKPSLLADFESTPIDSATAKSSIVQLNVFYDSLTYTTNTEVAQMDIVALLANIGGTLGLFMGVSVFSVCEIIELFIEIYFVKKRKK